MAIREIIQIDEEKCDGCGLCVPGCAEGALQIIDGKAKLVADIYCDGLGNCLGTCPQGAIQIIQREADDFDEVAVEELLKKQQSSEIKSAEVSCGCPSTAMRTMPKPTGGGCPGSALRSLKKEVTPPTNGETASPQQSQLGQWPVQIMLVPPQAPFLRGADVLICADCVPFALAGMHELYLKGRVVLVGCPKLDDLSHYRQKLEEVFRVSNPSSITVLRMEVPCCGGISSVVKEARTASGAKSPLSIDTVSVDGRVVHQETFL
jgi:ferredoxin